VGREPEKLGDILGRAVVGPARRQRSAVGKAKRKWEAVVGPELAAHSWPRSVRRGVLTVEVDSSGLLAELAGYRKESILDGMGREPEALGIRDVKFVLSEDET